MRHSLAILLVAAASLIVTLSAVSMAAAGDGCCAHCGCADGCQKVCRLVMEEKKVEVVCWGCKCEDFCLGGPSTPNCKHCEEVCAGDGKADSPCTHPKRFVWTEWCPSWAKVHTKKKLMKKTVTKKIPSYKWVVEDLCAVCQDKSPSADVPPGVEIPPAPVIDVKR